MESIAILKDKLRLAKANLCDLDLKRQQIKKQIEIIEQLLKYTESKENLKF